MVLMIKIKKRNKADKKFVVFDQKNCNLLIPRPSWRTLKLHEKSSAPQREHSVLQNIKFFPGGVFFQFLLAIFVLLDPDPDLAD
jgi:hypothetical protein